ncbi:UNVERIFIED_CONTAM: hypothetical protein Sradi_4371100 [Sesamum radiatum]|uniref:Reverse transcriptase zinc-binding domain-containing protein n=1 Tax=Sesamum radiatum TaxID=300843 RepID=A0AAW2NR99_SESRA
MRHMDVIRLRVHIVLSLQGLYLSTTSGSTSYKSANWHFIWSAAVPPKIKLFVWQSWRDSLPTSSNLQRRGVPSIGACPWCGTENEDLLHLLVHFPFGRLVWALSHLPWSVISTAPADPEVWFRYLHKQLNAQGFARALLVSWFLWGTRNRLLFENTPATAKDVIERVWSMEAILSPGARAASALEESLKAYQHLYFASVGIG